MGPFIRPRLTAPAARRIGLELGGVLLAVAAISIYRGANVERAATALVLGLLLFGVAIARPALLVPLAQRWMGMSSAIARVTSPLFLGAIYLVIFTPMAWVRRTFGRTPIARDASASTYWVRRARLAPDRARRTMERQF